MHDKKAVITALQTALDELKSVASDCSVERLRGLKKKPMTEESPLESSDKPSAVAIKVKSITPVEKLSDEDLEEVQELPKEEPEDDDIADLLEKFKGMVVRRKK